MKVQQELFAGAVEVSNDLDQILRKFGLSKARRIGAWISRFKHNSRHPSNKNLGPLTTQEIVDQELFLIKRAQMQGMGDTKFFEDKAQLNLELNADELLVCKGRIQGEFPIYIPDSSLYAEKLVEHAHASTLAWWNRPNYGESSRKILDPSPPEVSKTNSKEMLGMQEISRCAH